MAEPTCELTLLMPCLNEAETLAVCIRKARQSLTELGVDGEVLIADNGSTDGSQQIATDEGARVVPVPQKGYGSALLGGIEAANGRYVIMGDADDSYDWSNLGGFVEKLREGTQVVMGCRMPRGGGTVMPGAMPFLHRWLGNPGLSFAGRLFFGCKTTDFHCGMRGFDRDAIRALELKCSGMEFATEMVAVATIKGLSFDEVPLTLHPDGRSRPPHLRTWRDGWRHLRFMLLLSPKMLFLVPGLVMLIVGLLGFGFLLPGPVPVFGLNLDVNTLLLSTMLLLIGMQLVNFAVAARVYSSAQGFLPEPAWLGSWRKKLTLEHGLILGSLLLITGVVYIIRTLMLWSAADFGDLDYGAGLRQMIPGITAMALGAQTLFGSFFLSFLGVERR